MSHSRSPHGDNHCFQILAGQGFHWLLDVQMVGNTVDVVAIGGDGDVRQTLCHLGQNEVLKTSATDLRNCPFIVIFLAIIRPHAFRRNLLSGMRSYFAYKKRKTLENQWLSRVLVDTY